MRSKGDISLKKIIKYLQGGEYHEATVADVGDMDLLKTETKTDLVSAINEIFITGGQASGKPDGYDELVEKVEVIDSNTNSNSQSIADAVEDLDEAKRRLEQTAKEIENAKKQALADAQKAAQKAVDDYKQAREKLDNEIALAQKQLAQDIADKQSDIEKLNDEAGSLGKQLDTVRKDAEKTAEELSNVKLDFGNTKKQVVDLENEVSQKLSSTDLDPLKEKVESINSEVEQTKEQISQKVNKKDLDLLTGTVNDVKSELNLAADKIESKVSKDTLEKNISDFEVKKANLFLGTRDWLNCTFNDKALARVSSGTYKHTRVAALSSGGKITLRAERLTIGESYVVSVNARVNTGTAKVKVNDFGEMVTVDTKEYSVTNRWLRYYIVFIATSDVMDIGFRGADLENGAQLFLNKAKLERGTVAFPWEQNENDDYDRAEHTEARLTVYEDQISGVVKKQMDLGDRQTEMQTTLTQVAEGVEANSKLIDKTKDGLVKEFEGKLSSTAKALSAEYAEKTNEAFGQITDSGANLILNSSFSNKEDRLSKWQEVSNKANVITDDNGLSWLKMSQSGLDRDDPIGAKTNYFLVKKGKITVALDVKVDSRLDNDKILSVEFFDENNQRVDFKTFTMSELGVLNSSVGKQRGLIRVALDRTDVKKAAVKVTLTRNGSISVTNFLAKNSSIDDGAYTPAPEDTAEQAIKQNTKIDQNAREIQLKANKTETDNKFVDMNNELRQEIVTQKEATLRVTNEGIENVARKVETVRGLADNAQTTANRAQSVADSANATLGAYQKSTESSFKNLGDRIESEVSSVKSSIDNMQIGGVNRLQGSADFSWCDGIGWFNSPMIMIEDYSKDIKMLHMLGSLDGGIYTKWAKAFPNGEFQVGERYTLSFDAKGEGKFLAVGNESDGQSNKMPLVGKELTSEWKRYSVSGTITKLNKAFVFYFKHGYDVCIKCVKIEVGDKATPWTVAPEDIQSKIDNNTQAIESANSRFVQVENGFHETVNKVKSDLDGRITKNSNEIKSFDDKYSRELSSVRTDIGNIRIGGTNLLKDTTVEQQDVECPTTGWVNGRVFQTTQPLTESQYILSFEARGDSDAQRIATFLWHGGIGGINVTQKSTTSGGETFTASDGQAFVTLTSQWKRYWVLYEIKPDNTKKEIIIGRRWAESNPSGGIYIRKAKLETGNKATDYSPAPEDIQGKLNNYGDRLTVAESKVTQTVDGIESKVSKIVTDTTKKNGEAQNLVYNSEFINNAEGWSNIGNNPAGTILFANNEWDNWYGSNGLAFRNPSKQEYLVSDSKRFRVYEGQRLSASVQLHVTDNITHGQCRAGMEIKFYANENDPEIDTSKQQTQFMYNIQNGQQKLLYCENVEVPANANYVAIRLYTFGVGNIIFNQPMLVSGDKIQPYKQDVKATNSAITTMRQEADRWNVKVVGLESAINNKADKNKIITEINADTSGVKIAGNKNHITGETTIDDGVIKSAHIDKLDADKINGIEFSSGDNFYNKWEDRTRKPLMMNKNGIFASSSYIASVNDNINWRIPLGHLDTGTTYNNNCLDIATIKPKGLSGRILKHGDMIIISVQINYDNGQGDSRTTVLPQFGHNPWGEPFYEEMGESYKKGVITGDYWYTWKFKWKFEYLQQAQANGNSIPIQLRFDNLKPGSHVTITNATCWSTTKYDNGVYGYREAAFEISNDGEFRGTYLAKPVIESSRNTMDVIEWHEGRLRFAHGKEGEAPYPFGEIVINGSGINIFGQADGQDRRITFWGNPSHEQIVNNGGVTGDYDSLANGIYFDNFGNIRMSKNASKFCITRNDGTDVVQVWNHGEATLWMENGYVGRHLGLGSSGFIDASQNGNVFFKRNGRAGYVFLSDVNIDGWLGCNSFSNRSQLSIKKDVEKADESDLATKILGIDIGTWRYKTEDADDMRHIGAVIDDVNTDKKWLIPSDFLSKDGKSVLPLNLIGGLIATVKQQAKQISDMNLKLLSLELNKDGESNE